MLNVKYICLQIYFGEIINSGFCCSLLCLLTPYNAIAHETSQHFIKCSNITEIFRVFGWTIQVGQPQSVQNKINGEKYDWLHHSAGKTDEGIKQHSAAQNYITRRMGKTGKDWKKSVLLTRHPLPISGTLSFQAAGARFVSEVIYQSELVPAGLILRPARRCVLHSSE
jgi:hypothetical protein